MKSTGIKIAMLLLTVFNGTLLFFGLKTHPDWVLVVFCAAIFEILVFILYLQYRVYWVNSKSNSASVPTQIKNLKQHVDSVYNRVDALFSLHSIIKIRKPLPVMQDWRVASDYGHALVENILSRPQGDVLDVGSGISTLLAGYVLEKIGNGKVIALEHEEKYFKECARLISEHALERYATVYHCPLITHEINGEKWLWYDVSKVESLKDVNLVSVDGPPGDLQKLSRYPAVPLLSKLLSKDAVILLDDGARKDEQRIADRWRNEFNLEAEYVPNTKGMFVLRQKSAPL